MNCRGNLCVPSLYLWLRVGLIYIGVEFWYRTDNYLFDVETFEGTLNSIYIIYHIVMHCQKLRWLF